MRVDGHRRWVAYREPKLDESDFRYDGWVQALKDAGVEGMVICESPSFLKTCPDSA